MNMQTKFMFRAGTDADTSNRQVATPEVAATRVRQRGNSRHFDCYAEGSHAARAVNSAIGLPDFHAPPRRAAMQFNLNSRSWRSLAKHPELNRDSFVFANSQLRQPQQLQRVAYVL